MLVIPAVLLVVQLGVGCGNDDGGVTGPAQVAEVQVSPSADTLIALGATLQFSAVARDASGGTVPGQTFTWTSSDVGVATVNGSSGLVTAVASGDATITATTEAISGDAALTVRLSFAAVSGGQDHSCGVTTAGVAYCWGDNTFHQLGDGTTSPAPRTTPVAVAGGLTFGMVSTGAVHSCGVTIGGAAHCWGYNGQGRLGDGTTSRRSSPVAVVGGLTFGMLSTGGGHTCGITTEGAAYCWGDNRQGQLGDGTTSVIWRTSPVAVVGGLTFATVSAGGNHTCGVTTEGAAYCWGYNNEGQLGNGTSGRRTSPVAVAGGLTFATVGAGTFHTCGIATEGAAHCWGFNFYGQLGDGTSGDVRVVPVLVLLP
jgi:alpha-tubulin suppressor-like RCC1 family protein